jgi:hypothetical protein
MNVVGSQLRGINAYVDKRTNGIRAGQPPFIAATVECPECAQPALAGDGRPACRFCLLAWKRRWCRRPPRGVPDTARLCLGCGSAVDGCRGRGRRCR